MNMITTIDSMNIVWTFPEGQKFVQGIIFYGFLNNKNTYDTVNLKRALIESWKQSTINVECKILDYEGERFSVLIGEVMFLDSLHEAYWIENITNIMKTMSADGASIVWCGNELCSGDPYELSSSNPGIIYAAYTNKTGLICYSKSFDKLQYLTFDQILQIVKSVENDIFREYIERGSEEYDIK